MKLLKSLIAVFALALLFGGCSKLTKENYDQIKVGMSYDEVVSHIGKPSTCSETFGMKSCEWKSGNKKVVIGFIGDGVTVFSSENLK